MRPVVVTRQLAAADADGIAQAQTAVAAGSLTLNGALVTAGVAQLGDQRQVILTAGSGDDLSTVTFTIVGYDSANRLISESLTGPNDGVTSPVTSTLNYARVTAITFNAAFPAGDEVFAGTNGVGASLPIPLDIYLPFGNTASVDASGTINYSVQVSNSDPFGDPSTQLNWVAYPGGALTSQTGDVTSSTAVAYRALRILTNSGTGSAVLTVTQQGLMV